MLLLLLSHFSCVRLLRPHGLQLTRLLHPWDFPVGCLLHFLSDTCIELLSLFCDLSVNFLDVADNSNFSSLIFFFFFLVSAFCIQSKKSLSTSKL